MESLAVALAIAVFAGLLAILAYEMGVADGIEQAKRVIEEYELELDGREEG